MRLLHPDPPRTVTLPGLGRPGWWRLRVTFPPEGLVDVVAELRFANGATAFRRPRLLARNDFGEHFHVSQPIRDVVLHLSGSADLDRPLTLTLREDPVLSRAFRLARRGIAVLRDDPRSFVARLVQFAYRLRQRDATFSAHEPPSASAEEAYATWRALFDEHPDRYRARHAQRLDRLSSRPTISVLVADETDDGARVQRLLSDLEAQIYPDWELVVARRDPADPRPSDRPSFPAGHADRVRFVLADPGADRAARLNTALAAAFGRFVLVPPPDGTLRAHALLECALAIERRPDARLIFADEDRTGPRGERGEPRFKTVFSPELERSRDVVGDPTWFHAETLRDVGGWRTAIDTMHDVKLRFAAEAGTGSILHLAKVLTSRSGGSTPSRELRLAAVSEQARHLGLDADAVWDARSPHPRLRYRLPATPPLVSLIVPTRDRADLLRTCIGSILNRTDYGAFEILIVDNGSTERDALALLESLAAEARVRVLPYPAPFNYSAINNHAVAEARGTVIGLLNNDVEVIAADWLSEMTAHALRPEIGCVGAKLLYPDGTLQHGGVVTGLQGGAGHVHRGLPRDAPGPGDRLVSVRSVSAVTAACLIVRKRIYEDVGGLDEQRLRVAFNDVDFCLKVEAAGYLNLWTPFAELYHHESASRGADADLAKARRFAGETNELWRRWGSRLLDDPHYPLHETLNDDAGGIRLS